MVSVFTDLKYLTSVNDSSKSDLDDFGQKWKHTATQFEFNRRFARSHNPDDENMTAGPGIYDNYKIQVNVYGETSVYKRDCGQLVPKTAVATKTDWREGRSIRDAKPKKYVSQQQMTVSSAPARPQGVGRGNGGYRPPATGPVVAVAAIP